ncbi:hypothetical protein [Williamsia sp.]|uniref:hypothetical protein n=1 Tax=Williamsia sp. TaxID=1872085 RepID=UPI002F91CF8D
MKVSAVASRDGKFWLVHVPEIGHYTQARTVREIESMVTDLVAVSEEVPAESVEVTSISFTLPDDVQEQLHRAEERQQDATRANSEAAEARRAAARLLHDKGLTYRDVGGVLGISHQRAAQLIAEVGASPNELSA